MAGVMGWGWVEKRHILWSFGCMCVGVLEKTLLCAGLSRVVLVGYWAVRALFPGGCEPSSAGSLGRTESGLATQPLRGPLRRLFAHASGFPP